MPSRPTPAFLSAVRAMLSRRQLGLAALGGLAGQLVGRSTPATTAVGKRRKHPKCKAPTRRCGKRCVNVRVDPMNCGRCKQKCPGTQACRNRRCVVLPESPPTFIRAWEAAGLPEGIAINADGNLLITEWDASRPRRYSPGGAQQGSWPSALDTDGVRAIAAGPAGESVAIADDLEQVHHFDAAGNLLATWSGPGVNSFEQIASLAVTAAGTVVVVDESSNRIHVFGPTGELNHTMGGVGHGIGQFSWPQGVGISPDGTSMVIADSHNKRIQKLALDGTVLWVRGSDGLRDGQFRYPASVAIDGSDNTYVADAGRPRIQKFAPDGTLLVHWTIPYDGQDFDEIVALAIDRAAGRLYVVADEFESFRVLEYEL